MNVVVSIATLVAAMLSLAKWLRVSQREHYLPYSVSLTAKRWLTLRPPNLVVGLGWLALAVASALLGSLIGGASGVGAAAIAAVWPIGMSARGTPRLRFTRRAIFQGGTASVITIAAVIALSVLVSGNLSAALTPIVAGLSVDIGAWANRPVERRITWRFRRKADEKLRRTRPRVVAITGSYGKTTVKNHVRDLVGSAFDTLATPASWNNLAGLSRTINEQMTSSTEVFIAEMGTYGPGEIEEMVAWLQPEISVITAIGPVHLERMKTLDGVLAAKSEIFQGARVAIVCADSAPLRHLGRRLRESGARAEVWIAGSGPENDHFDVWVTESNDRTTRTDELDFTVVVHGEVFGTVPRGSLHPGNVACAVATTLALGVDRRVVHSALPRLTASSHRSTVATTDDGITVVDDTFNSNPNGARASLALLIRTVPEGRRVVATPGMVEMGDLQFAANLSFAEEVAESGTDLLIVGWTNRRALLAGCPEAHAVRDRESARRWLKSSLVRGDGVLWENDLPDHYP